MFIATIGNTVKQTRTGLRFLINCVVFTFGFCFMLKFFTPMTREFKINRFELTYGDNVEKIDPTDLYFNGIEDFRNNKIDDKKYWLVCGQYKIEINSDDLLSYDVGDIMLITTNSTGDILYSARPKKEKQIDINNLIENSQYRAGSKNGY